MSQGMWATRAEQRKSASVPQSPKIRMGDEASCGTKLWESRIHWHERIPFMVVPLSSCDVSSGKH
jgi:hypothetical protein